MVNKKINIKNTYTVYFCRLFIKACRYNTQITIPIAPIVETLGIPAATVPTVNIDNNQHSPNENLRLGNFLEGIAILVAVLGQDPG